LHRGGGFVVDEGLIPVDLEVGGDAQMRCAEGEFVGQVYGDGAGESGGEAHVGDDFVPGAVGVLGFDVGGDGGEAGLPGGVHGAGGEVLDEAVEEETEGALGGPGADVEGEGVEVGEAGEGEVGEVADIGGGGGF